MTDELDPEVASVPVTVAGVDVHHAGSGGWRTVLEGPVSFDLIALSGVEAVLAAGPLEAGRYTQVRLRVVDVEVTRAGKLAKAEVPGDALKLVGTFVLEPGETTIVTLDFDVEKSLLERGGGTPLLRRVLVFKPVVKLLIGEPGQPGQPTVPLTGALPMPAPIPTPTSTLTPTSGPTPGPAPTATPAPTAMPAPTPAPAIDIDAPRRTHAPRRNPRSTARDDRVARRIR